MLDTIAGAWQRRRMPPWPMLLYSLQHQAHPVPGSVPRAVQLRGAPFAHSQLMIYDLRLRRPMIRWSFCRGGKQCASACTACNRPLLHQAHPVPGCVPRAVRQSGQALCMRSHRSTHAWWNTWQHCGSSRTFSPCANPSRQIAHSPT